ncbi:hypothetical protein E3N85_09390 [Cryobacterium sp. Hz9]|nr:hypothetical protein E3N85_09390 [Cryobacterium sp. Hz9]
MRAHKQDSGLPQQLAQIATDKYRPVEPEHLNSTSPTPISLTWEERGGAGDPSRWRPSRFPCSSGSDIRKSAPASTGMLSHGRAELFTLNGKTGESISTLTARGKLAMVSELMFANLLGIKIWKRVLK